MGDSEPTKAADAALSVWLVSFGETDDREMHAPQIAEALLRGEIGEETIVWREGLPEWVPLGSVPELAQLLPSSGLTANAPAKPLASLKPSFPSKQLGSEESEEKVPAAALEEEQPVSLEPESVDPISSEGGIARAEALSAGTLAAPKRGLPAAPLPPKRDFVPEPRPEPEDEPPPSSGTPSLHTLAVAIRTTSHAVDDEIVNLGMRAPEAFGPPTIDLVSALAAPEQPPVEAAVAAPVARAAEAERDAAPAEATAKGSRPEQVPVKKRSVLPWLALAAMAVAVPALALRGRRPEPSLQSRASEVAATAVPTPPEPRPRPETESAASVATDTTASAPVVPVPAAPSTTSAAQVAAPVVVAVPTSQVVKSDKPKQSSNPVAATPSATPEPAAAPKPVEAPTATDEAEPEGPAFDVAAAQAALGAAAAEAATCRKEGDPTGTAGVRVTFSNSGTASRAIIEGPPFAGTETGSCIAAAMRKAKVPPYSGDRVTVFKHVVVQ